MMPLECWGLVSSTISIHTLDEFAHLQPVDMFWGYGEKEEAELSASRVMICS